ncbi:peptidoglycan/LPS O-acetylase OafA/YrhL [Dysgonomonas sp. PH5-45]|uniref:acyltransferase family protein n=1 Tax=unclassified Dysgonomonas TaxID=2630389 RepID=UPI0024742A9E|nr:MULTISPECIES: acyltransferase [unclassified Dysgonomonas]MDH6354949.1 peptidoglycan/LPS O-acetylase OafA/YrhL [Dysgonomonas sp. PH5-45]MDH6387848.1 peptidoglycan/LPS O-acetylase OafA/YrhL [Dysgonomonas sp. PH5-37]
MNIKLFSEYRLQLLGIAIIWCLLFHSGYHFSIHSFNYLVFYGWAGVDMFLLLSGLGIYFSLRKNSSIKEFYKRRFFRIYPSFVVAIVVHSIYKSYSLSDTILDMLTINYWIGSPHIFNWFISGLIAFYLLSPWYYKLFKRNPGVTTVVGVLFSLLLVFITPLYLFFFITRIPIFLIGFYIGYLIAEKKETGKPNKKYVWIMFSAFVFGCISLFLVHKNIFVSIPQTKTLCMVFIIPFLCLFIAKILSVFKNYKYPFLSFVGKYTFPLYLFYDMIADYLIRVDYALYKIVDISSYPLWVSEIIVAVIGLIFSYFFQNMMDKITDKIRLKLE